MRILCLYVPRLPVKLAERQRPALEGQAVVFLTGAGGDGLVASCSAAAAAAGIVCGLPAGEARRLAPNAVFLSDNAAQCLDELERAAGILRARATALVEVGGRDRLFLDLDSVKSPYSGDESRLADRLRSLAANWLGLEVRAGVGGSRQQALSAARKARRFPIVFTDATETDELPIRNRAGESLASRTVLSGSGPKKRAGAVALAGRLATMLAARGESFREMTVVMSTADGDRRLRLKARPGADPVALLSESVDPADLEDAEAIRVELGALCPDLATLPYVGGAAVAPMGFSRRASGRGVASPVPLLAAG